jgi:PilZ domain-containing protein
VHAVGGRGERNFDRVNANITVRIEGEGTGETRNLSPGGVFFVTDERFEPGNSLHFTVEFENPSGNFYLDCVGEIVRVESTEGRVGVAARIIDSRLERRTTSSQQKGAEAIRAEQ